MLESAKYKTYLTMLLTKQLNLTKRHQSVISINLRLFDYLINIKVNLYVPQFHIFPTVIYTFVGHYTLQKSPQT